MKKNTVKRILLWVMAAVLCLGCCLPALASEGDRTLLHYSLREGGNSYYITQVFSGDRDIIVLLNGSDLKVLRYTDPAGEPEEYVMPRETADAGLTEDGMSVSRQTVCWFSWNSEIYAVQIETKYDLENGSSEVEGGFVRHLALKDGQAVLEECDIPRLDWSVMIDDSNGSFQNSRWMNRTLVSGDRMIGQTYDNRGQNMLVFFDLTTGDAEELSLAEIGEIYPGPDGTILYTRYEWAEETRVHVIRLDPADQSEEEMAVIPLGNGYLTGLTYDQGTDTLYYVRGGELWAAPGLDVDSAIAVNDCPISNEVTSCLLPDGRILLWSNDVAMIRNTDPALRSEGSLVIQDYIYSESLPDTVYDFGSVRGDLSVVLRREGDASQVLQAMMNRDAQVDIYSLEYSSSQFEALRSRGFLADLSGNTQLAEAVSRMVPFMQDALQQDGKIIAAPVSLYGSFLGYRPKVWEKLGFTEEDLPKTWDQFFDLLESLPEKMEGSEYAILETWTSRESFRSFIMTTLINQYQIFLNSGDREYAFNTPLLRNLMDRLDRLDYDALGMRTQAEEEDAEEGMVQEYKTPLFECYTQVTVASWGSDDAVLPLSLEEGEEPVLPVTLHVAFVNPYSENAEAAAEYLAMSLNNLQTATKYSIFGDLNEPIRYPDYEETKQNLQTWLEQAQEMLEKADEENREMLEETVKTYQESVDSFDEEYWMVSPAGIEEYRNHQAWIRVLSYDFVTELISKEQGGETGYYELVDAYAQGQTTAEDLLTAIDRKVQMMRLEGN